VAYWRLTVGLTEPGDSRHRRVAGAQEGQHREDAPVMI
jgi:hypothetical protein